MSFANDNPAGSASSGSRHFARVGVMAFLVVALSAACIPCALAASQESARNAAENAGQGLAADMQGDDAGRAIYQKNEVVYAVLSAAGDPEAVYAVNRFQVEQAGMLVDYGDYASVKNLSGDSDLGYEGEAVAVEVSEGVFYYQGNLCDAVLPWKVSLSYELDGKPVAPEELAGASGQLAIHVSTARNAAVDSAFYDGFMLQITFTLDERVASNIVAQGATVASAGQSWTVAFTVLPGHDGDFTLEAQVEDFSMDGAQIAALPYSSVVEMPDTSEMADGMEDLASAVSQLADGTAELSAGVARVSEGAQTLSAGSQEIGQALGQLGAGAASLVDASGKIDDALSAVAAGVQGADLSALEDLEQLPAALRQLADGLDGQGGLLESVAVVQGAYGQAVGVLDEAVASIPEAMDEAALGSLGAVVSANGSAADVATFDQLIASYQAVQYVRAAYYGPNGTDGVRSAFDAADALLTNLAADAVSGGALATSAQALRAMADGLDAATGAVELDQLANLIAGLGQLASEYARFHEGIVGYAAGISALSSQYGAFASGTSSLASGMGELAAGAGDLSAGMAEFDESVGELPATMRERIDEMTAEFAFPEFDPVSFVSSENENVAAVQFVMTTAAIEKPTAEEEEESAEADLTLWDRLCALFQ